MKSCAIIKLLDELVVSNGKCQTFAGSLEPSDPKDGGHGEPDDNIPKTKKKFIPKMP